MHDGQLFFAAVAAVYGSCLGSFAGVLVDRLPRAQSVLWPGSRCGSCDVPIAWYDNVPLLAYLRLWGRCRHCRAPIGLRAPCLELLVALLAAALVLRLGVGLELAAWLPVLPLLLAIVLLDIDYFWVPDVLSLPSAAWLAAASVLPGRLGPLAALLGLLPVLALWGLMAGYARLVGREGMGLGDLKLLAAFGLGLGATGALQVLLWASLQGTLVGLVLLAGGGHRGKLDAPLPAALADDADWQPPPHALPFGPFLVLAGLEVLLCPEIFVDGQARIAAWLVEQLATG